MILVVDDNQDTRQSLRLLFAAEGWYCRVARSGQEALWVVQSHCDEIQLIVLDLLMPTAVNGWDLLDELAKDTKFYGIPVLVCTGYAEMEERLSKRVTLLAKPYDPEVMLATVRKLIGGEGNPA